MRHAGNGANSDVLVDEIVGGEVYERIIRLDWILISPLSKLCQLVDGHALHGLEYFYQVIGLFAERGIVRKRMEFAVNASGPTCDLVVYDVNFLELFLQLVVVAGLPANRILHFEDVLVLELGVALLSGCGISLRVNLKIVKSVTQHLVVFFQDVDLLIAVIDVLQEVRVGLLSRQETLH